MKGITPKEWRLFWTTTGILAALSGLVTALVVIVTTPPVPKGILPPQNPFHSNVDSTIPHELFLHDFQFAEPGGHWLSQPWSNPQDRAPSWVLKELIPYWSGPENLKIFKLPQENDQKMKEILRDVP